jgi:transposase-like protein
MATGLEEYPTKEQWSVMRFLWAKGLSAKDIHKEMFIVYRGKCLLHKVIHNWVEKFSQRCRKSQIIPDQVTLLKLRQKQLCSG